MKSQTKSHLDQLFRRLSILPDPTPDQEQFMLDYQATEAARIRAGWSEHTAHHRLTGQTIADQKAAQYEIPQMSARELVKNFSR